MSEPPQAGWFVRGGRGARTGVVRVIAVALAFAGATGASRALGGELPLPGIEACGRTAQHYEAGELRGIVCTTQAAASGLTVVELGDDWVPTLFSEVPEIGEAGVQPYRATFRALMGKRVQRRADGLPDDEAYLELFGVFPTLPALFATTADPDRHACFAGVDHEALTALDRTLRREGEGEGRRREIKRLHTALLELQGEAHAGSYDELVVKRRAAGPLVKRLRRIELTQRAVDALQRHLVCDGLLRADDARGSYTMPTHDAVVRFQRRYAILTLGGFDEETARMMVVDSRERDLRAMLRVLRERVVEATGLIEDGSALGKPEAVMGQTLDSRATYADAGYEPLANGAPDVVARATHAAAEQLGWVSFGAAAAFVARHERAMREGSLLVAVRLPARPDYYTGRLTFRAVIDRGDVYYDMPLRDGPAQVAKRKPTTTLYARGEDGREVALFRWRTTIGGWQREKIKDGRVVAKYKNSPHGEFAWKRLYAAPAWYPPDSTPPRELLTPMADGSLAPNLAAFGPHYRSAYGLMALFHSRVSGGGDDEFFSDTAIRSHGSAAIQSIIKGFSHGCHRLMNHLAIRLGSYLLHHHEHVRHGSDREPYVRTIGFEGKNYRLRLTDRGYEYELTPPVPVTVLEGRVRGVRRQPSLKYVPLE